MTRIASRMYLTAIAILVFLKLFSADPWTAGPLVSPTALLVPIFSSLPLIAFMILVLGWIRYLQPGILGSWIILIPAVGILAFLPCTMVSWIEYSRMEWSLIIPGIFAAYGALLFQALPLHHLFEGFHQENELYSE